MARTAKGGGGIPTVVEAIVADPELTPAQKDILIGMYDRMVNGDGGGSAPGDPMVTMRLRPLADVCPVLGVSLRTGYRWVADGCFPVPEVRVGSKIMFRPADVEAFLAGRR